MSSLRKIEWGISLLATGLALYLHLVFFKNAGALWRDEINSVSIANLSSIHDVWTHIEFDSFPIFWLLVLRVWSFITGASDLAYRLFGLGMGITVLAILWFGARVFKMSFPMFSIALLALSPAIIRWGDSVRGYGLGIFAILFSFALVWKVIEQPSSKNICFAALSALVAVQSLYYNAVLIFAICTGGLIVAAKNRSKKLLVALLLIGGISALSLLPYLPVFKRSQAWAPIFQFPARWRGLDLSWYWHNLSAALNASGQWVVWAWVGVFLMALGSGLFCLARKGHGGGGRNRSDLAAFASAALFVGFVSYYLFLRRLQYLTQTWYYVALIAFTAWAIDVLLSLLNDSKRWRIFRLCLVALFVTLTFRSGRSIVHTRMTNVDLAAHLLEQNSAPGDIILVTPWYCGITFSRYYHATAWWATIPPIDDHRFHRVDLLQNHMTASNQGDPVRPILEKIETTLKAGKRVWIVGKIRFLGRGQVPPLLLAAPNENSGWYDLPYYEQWAMQVAYFVQTHALDVNEVRVPAPSLVNEHENLPVIVVQGWSRG